MIIFKTEMNEMPISCNYCVVRHICKPELNLSPRDTKQIVTFLEHCPLLEIPDPKPEPTLTQHEHDLIEIIKKVYPDKDCIVIINNDYLIRFVSNSVMTQLEQIYSSNPTVSFHSPFMELFDKTKLPTLLSEFENNRKWKVYNINDLLSRPIRKEI